MYTCVTTVPISTHQFPAGNHRLTELRYTLKHHPLKFSYRQQLCHSVAIVTGSCNVVHSGQHFPLLRILFEPKSWNEIIECPLWEYGSRGHFDLLIQTTNFIAWFLRQQIASFDFISFMRILTNQVLCQMKKFLICHFYLKVTASDLHPILPIGLIGK